MRFSRLQWILLTVLKTSLTKYSDASKENERRLETLLIDPSLSRNDPESAWRHALPGSPPVDYGGSHPFEIKAKQRRLIQDVNKKKNDMNKEERNLAAFEVETFEPIRITVDYDLPPVTSFAIRNKNNFIRSTVIPEAISFWQNTLSVYPAQQPFIVPRQSCALASNEDESFGVQDSDLKLYVGGVASCGDGTLAAAASCHWDQFDRPIGGIIQFCYDSFSTNPTEQERTTVKNTAIHELLHVFGFKDSDFPYYYDIKTGLPRTQRPVEQKEVQCNDGSLQTILYPSEETVKRGITNYGVEYYAVSTPTVRQIVRNQFDCQEMEGARLENQPTGRSCFGDHWEERLFFNSLMSSGISSLSSPEFLTPVTFALLEDTGWYVANYDLSTKSPFGLGAGCEFVNEPCIVDGNIPTYSEGSFCNTRDMDEFGCDPTHRLMANCDLMDYGRSANNGPGPEMQYFLNPELGGKFLRADFCPTFTDELAACTSDFRGRKMWEGEDFGSPNSRCFKTNDLRPYCMKTRCNDELNVIEVMVDETVFASCEFDGQMLEIEGNLVECPKFTTICPNSFCPSNCKGQGQCNYDLDVPECDDLPPQTFSLPASAIATRNETNINEENVIVQINNMTLNPTSAPPSLNGSFTLPPTAPISSVAQNTSPNNTTTMTAFPTSAPPSLNGSFTLPPTAPISSAAQNTSPNNSTTMTAFPTSAPPSLNGSFTLPPTQTNESSALNPTSQVIISTNIPTATPTMNPMIEGYLSTLSPTNAFTVTNTQIPTTSSTTIPTKQLDSSIHIPVDAPPRMQELTMIPSFRPVVNFPSSSPTDINEAYKNIELNPKRKKMNNPFLNGSLVIASRNNVKQEFRKKIKNRGRRRKKSQRGRHRFHAVGW